MRHSLRNRSAGSPHARRPAALALLIVCAILASCSKGEVRSHERRVVILGIDGMDHKMTTRLMKEGKLPNLQKLAERGSFSSLRTTDPPQSPVAWSTFITGLNPSEHGIYDFVHRDPAKMAPYLSTSRVEEVDCVFALGDYALQTCSPEMLSLRRGKPFWEFLQESGVPASIYKVPANFPPNEKWKTETISGMGTPDVMGTYGTFQLITTDPDFKDKKLSGGMVRIATKTGSKVTATIAGPPDPTRITEEELQLPVEVLVRPQEKAAVVRLADRDFLLQRGEWTGWIPIAFEPKYGGSVPGIVRLHLRDVDPVEIYVSPVNINPKDPIMPISSPKEFSKEFADAQGLYYTQGMPEDTKALSGGVLGDDDFLRQADLVFEERIRMLRAALDRYEGGLMFFYFSSVDQVSHMFWRAQSVREDHELYPYRDVVLKKYLRVDEIVGEVMEKLGDDTDIIVMSDHGFGDYIHKVNLNTWLFEKGYLALREDGHGGGPLGHIDWDRTQAYALGLNQLFINREGREAHGVIDDAEAANILSRLKSDLKRWRDPNTGRRVVRDVVEPGASKDDGVAPDIIVGYARDYRSSDASAMGEIKDEVVEPNNEHWNSDHCVASELVPGVVFSTRKITKEDPGLNDFAPTILEDFGIGVPDNLPGASLHKPTKKD